MSRSSPTRLRRASTAWRPSLRMAVLAASATIVLALAFGIAVSASDHLRASATESELGNAEAIVRGYVDPILTEEGLGLGATPDPEVAAQLARLVASGDMRQINVRTRDGLIMYSTEPSLRGVRQDIDHDLGVAFAGDSVGTYGRREAADPAAGLLPDRYLEIIVPIRGLSDGNPIGVFEVYVSAQPIEERVEATRRDVFLISLALGSVLLGLLWLTLAGTSRRLTEQNRRLRQLNERLHGLAGDLAQSEARFRSLVQNSSDVVTVLDELGRVTYTSDALRRVLGHEPSSMLRRPFISDVHPEDAAHYALLIAGVRETAGAEHAAEFRLCHADGSWRWVEAVGLNLSADPAVGGVVLNFRDVTERRQLEEQLQHEAFHDPLTGLANRALFSDRVTHALTLTRPDADPRLAVLFVDLDDFKVVNDSLGHAAGDELLAAVAERIRGSLRPQDTAARLGGDEFGILLEEAGEEVAADVAGRILTAIDQPFTLVDRQIFVQASIGIALSGGGLRGRRQTADELQRNADAAMYSAKARGKGRHEFYEARMHTSALQRLELRGRLEAALEVGDFVVHYQPVVELGTGEVHAVEALVRWRQPDGRLAMPAEFVPLAEETGLIVALGNWVLQESCRQAAAWHRSRPAPRLAVAVNVASRQLQEPGFVESVEQALRSGLPASQLVLELTESTLLDDGETTSASISGVKALGVRVALDDFGTGYSSISHLRRFPIDILKIDRTFVDGIDGSDEGERALVHSIIRLARSMALETVAEGVERPTQVVRLRALGAHFGQGYHFARPMAASDLLRFLDGAARAAS